MRIVDLLQESSPTWEEIRKNGKKAEVHGKRRAYLGYVYNDVFYYVDKAAMTGIGRVPLEGMKQKIIYT